MGVLFLFLFLFLRFLIGALGNPLKDTLLVAIKHLAQPGLGRLDHLPVASSNLMIVFFPVTVRMGGKDERILNEVDISICTSSAETNQTYLSVPLR